ncbi:FKBP-type peptidyl-prolyl cis-trans isomerase [Patescibacteria group bacterium]|nr:MAG: FKBP-type peptidyl-prolyl cis-trans isomerase [Patescibacteria group bacterium]
MSRKQTNIIIILAVSVVVIFVGLGFFGLGGFGLFGQQAPQANEATGVQAILNEVQQTGTVSQLRYEDVILGEGDAVVVGDTLSVKYIGVLPDGTVFDSTEAHDNQPFEFTIGAGGVIPGWEQGLLGMKVGGRRLLAIPPSLGYGAQAVGPIPANATLIFDVQLIARTPGSAVPAQ